MNELNTLELEQLFSFRGAIYQLLSRFYRREMDQELLNQLHQLEFEADITLPEILEGNRLLKIFLAQMGENALTDLAVDYAKIFLGAGPTCGEGAYPYESVYTSPDRLLMQNARDQAVAIYRSEDIRLEDSFNEPEDHIAIELTFMAYLCQKTSEAIRRNDEAAANSCLLKQRQFLQDHLLSWVPNFCADVQRIAATDFYKAIAMITYGFLIMDRDMTLGKHSTT
ncbi:MAG: cytoplasmic chaperone TorD [Firmicutes bacterium]|nr:cytoplasmic chaperone TorD [Bacillota bacterium]